MTSLVGRNGTHLTGSDGKDNGHVLGSLDFDAESREMLGLEEIEDIRGQVDKDAEVDLEEMQAQAKAVKEGSAGADIRDPDEAIEQIDQEVDDGTQSNGDGGGAEQFTAEPSFGRSRYSE